MSAIGYITVHAGAGIHGTKKEKEVKSALRKYAENLSTVQACSEGLFFFSASTSHVSLNTDAPLGTDALSMVEQAIVVLENDEHLNAGYGSNLTIDGTVECDSSIMHGSRGLAFFGSTGAVSGVKNPIKLARSVLDYSRIPDKLGRIPPLTLVSLGAHKFAEGRVEIVSKESLIAPTALDLWIKWKEKLESANSAESMKIDDDVQQVLQDTVGAVAFHNGGGMAAGVSSGGLLLKHSGRIGEAAVYGAGCWATENMACSVSGTGEHIIRASLARKIGEALHFLKDEEEKDPHEVLNRVLIEFWGKDKQGETSPSVGVILLTTTKDANESASVRMWCGFTTASMAVGYASTQNPKPKAVIFRHPNPKSNGRPQIFITSLSL